MHFDTQPTGTLIVISTSRLLDLLLLGALLCTIPTMHGTLNTSFSMREYIPLIGTAIFLLESIAAYG
jgi:hypothetical protein